MRGFGRVLIVLGLLLFFSFPLGFIIAIIKGELDGDPTNWAIASGVGAVLGIIGLVLAYTNWTKAWRKVRHPISHKKLWRWLRSG